MLRIGCQDELVASVVFEYKKEKKLFSDHVVSTVSLPSIPKR